MKLTLLIFFLYSGTLLAADIDRENWIPPQDIYQVEELNRVLFSDLKHQHKGLQRVKLHLINGDTRLARIELIRLAYTHTQLKPVINRYLAILSFNEGQYQKAYEYLSLPELQDIPHYSKICILKVLTQIVLDKKNELEESWAKCQIQNPRNFQDKNLIWLETLVQLKLSPRPGITKVPFKRLKLTSLNTEDAKVMIKLALYLNQESLIVDQLSELTVEQLRDPELREIAGHVFFRVGSLARAYKFVEDLNSPNAENIKGNLYLLRGKTELAYAQFKLALEIKRNSQNALERLLPLAWLLKDWNNGARYSEEIVSSPETQMSKLTLHAAFLMQQGEYQKSIKVLDYINHFSRRGSELEVTQLAAFNSLMLNKPHETLKEATKSCSQYDLISCWLMFQLKQWDSFPLTIRRKEEVYRKETWKELITKEINEPLQETVFINQIDIEEMDDKLIRLIPTP